MSTHLDAICANNEVGGDCPTVRKSDGSGGIIYALAAGMEVIVFHAWRGCAVSHVIDNELARDAFTFPRGRSVTKTFVHILTVEHVMHIPPGCFVVAQVGLIQYTPGLPVTPNELLKDNRFHHRDVNFPLPEPLGTLNNGIIFVTFGYF